MTVRNPLCSILIGTFLILACRTAAGQPAPEPGSDLPAIQAVDEACTDDPPDPQEAPPVASPSAPGGEPGILKTAGKDARILAAPVHWDGKDWLLFVGAAGAIVLVGAYADLPAQKLALSHQTKALDDFTKVVAPFGEQYGWAVIGAYGIAGFVFKDRDARYIAVDSALATLIASGLMSPAIKVVMGRARPEEGKGHTSFDPFSATFNSTSFPAGHATQAFAIASVIAAHTDSVWVSATAYTIASLVGFSRIYQNVHWTSDVIAGALLGTAVGHSVVGINTKLREQDVQISVTPFYLNGRQGAALTLSF